MQNYSGFDNGFIGVYPLAIVPLSSRYRVAKSRSRKSRVQNNMGENSGNGGAGHRTTKHTLLTRSPKLGR